MDSSPQFSESTAVALTLFPPYLSMMATYRIPAENDVTDPIKLVEYTAISTNHFQWFPTDVAVTSAGMLM